MTLTKDDLQAIQGLLEPINRRLDNMESRLDNMESRLDRLEKNQIEIRNSQEAIRNSQTKVENIQFPRITAALDGVVSGFQRNTEQDAQIFVLQKSVENHENRIVTLEYAAKAR